MSRAIRGGRACLVSVLWTIALVSVVSTQPVMAESLSGRWGFKGTAMGREVQLTLDLEQTADRLSGTVRNQQGQQFSIKDGSVNGEAVSFTLEGDGRMNGAKVSGQSSQEGLTLTFKLKHGELKGVARRTE
jgi:hypothetical protein